jgi:hypothetical protein
MPLFSFKSDGRVQSHKGTRRRTFARIFPRDGELRAVFTRAVSDAEMSAVTTHILLESRRCVIRGGRIVPVK